MNIAAYLRYGITVIFCPRCQAVREFSRAPIPADDASCSRCGGFLETVIPPDGSALAVAK